MYIFKIACYLYFIVKQRVFFPNIRVDHIIYASCIFNKRLIILIIIVFLTCSENNNEKMFLYTYRYFVVNLYILLC